MARLAPGVTAEQASCELAVITERLNADGLYPPTMEFSAFAVPVADEIAGELRTALTVLFGAVGFAGAPGVKAGPRRRPARGRPHQRRTRTPAGAQRAVAEVAVALLLLIGAGLLIRSFAALRAVDPGFDAASVLAVDLSLPRASYPDDAAVISLYDELRRHVGALPGVEGAGFVRVLPLDTTIGDSGIDVEGRPVEANRPRPTGDWQVASPGYLEAMGLKLIAGRFFTDVLAYAVSRRTREIGYE